VVKLETKIENNDVEIAVVFILNQKMYAENVKLKKDLDMYKSMHEKLKGKESELADAAEQRVLDLKSEIVRLEVYCS
jgi:hypothetical protein